MRKGISFGITPEPEQIDLQDSCKVFGKQTLLTQPHEIEYYKTIIREFELENLLLGSIDNDGEYKIDLGIKKELIKIDKEIIEEGQDRILAFAHLLKKDMHFAVDIEEIDDINIKASLFVNEKVVGYEDFSSLRTFIGSLILDKNTEYRSKIFSVFHLSNTKVTIDEGKTGDLTIFLQDMLDEKLCLDDIIEIDSQIYVLRMLKLLEQQGEKGQKVLAEFKESSEKQGLGQNLPDRSVKMRKLLDNIIEKHQGEKEVFKQNEELVKIKTEYTNTIKKVIEINKGRQDALHNPKASEPKKVDNAKSSSGGAKAPAKKASAAKSAGKKDAKKPEKKADKKKDDKKKDDAKKDDKKKASYTLEISKVQLKEAVKKFEDVLDILPPITQPPKKESPKQPPKTKEKEIEKPKVDEKAKALAADDLRGIEIDAVEVVSDEEGMTVFEDSMEGSVFESTEGESLQIASTEPEA